MSYRHSLFVKAVNLRKNGLSLHEISNRLKIAKSTASLWLRDINLNEKAKKRLSKRSMLGTKKANKTKQIKKDLAIKKVEKWAYQVIHKIKFSPHLLQTCCSLLYWAEGGKFAGNRLEFTNSDPLMIETFLYYLRKGFNIDESKLRANIHLHEYHNDEIQKDYWHKITKIPMSQFNKSYIKPHTHKTIRKNYPGCVRICYYSADTARKIKALYSTLACTR